MSQSFPPEFRLRSKTDFDSLKGGNRLHIDNLRFVYRENNLSHARLGLAVSRKYGNAVKRNRLKRILRERFRQHDIVTESIDILVFPTRGADQTSDFSSQMDVAFQKIIRRVNRS